MRIANNIEILELGGPDGAIYPTLAWDEQNLVLIDAGFPGMTNALVRAIADAGFDAGRITHIILTHQDIDHIGCVTDILALAPSARVLAHTEEAPYIDGRKTPVKLAALMASYDKLPADQKAQWDKMQAAFLSRKIPIHQTLTDGEVLPLCGGIEVIHTPGHTPGHICLFLREGGVLAGGDAVNIACGQAAGPNSQHSCDMEQGMLSMEKVMRHPVRTLVSYHCGVLKM